MASLILADGSGKILGAVPYVLGFRYLGKGLQLLRGYSFKLWILAQRFIPGHLLLSLEFQRIPPPEVPAAL